MAIDLRQERQRQERQQRQRQGQEPQQPRRPVAPIRPRGMLWVALALAAVVAVGAGIFASSMQDQPAPTGGVAVRYPEGASTGERERGVYVVVPEPVAGFTDTAVGVREGGSYGLAAGFTDTAVGVREGGSYATTP
jgi:hypothetical protein